MPDTNPVDPQVSAAGSAPVVGGTPTAVIPGTDIPIPVGSGVETLQAIDPPFRTNAPAWYTPGVWGKMGCAVPQVGRYLQTNNGPIWDFVTEAGSALFNLMWKYDDRKFTRPLGKDILWDFHQLLVIGRKRLADKTVVDNQSPLLPTHARPAPKMFLVYPVPLYGPLGCRNTWLQDACSMALMMISEAMQHADNEIAFYYSKSFFDTLYGYIKYLLVDLAAKFFGIAPADASKDDFVVPADKWAAYNPSALAISREATTSRPPMGWTPTDLDLEPINGIPLSTVIPLLQPWPDSQLKYSSGGVWAGQPQASSGGTQTTAAAGATVNSSVFAKQGPPSA